MEFCGKGTSLLAARLLNLDAYGLDASPEAVVCSAAKLVDLTIEDVEAYLDAVPIDASRPSQDFRQIPARVHIFFHDSTLSQTLQWTLRLVQDLHSDSVKTKGCATFTMACLLGILHGHSSFSLSISSAHAYAMAPAYVARFAERNNLEAPRRDVRDCLRIKARRVLQSPRLPRVNWRVEPALAQDCVSIYPDLVGEVDMVLTSPPYLNAQTYAKDNWLRLWLLGHDYKSLLPRYLQTGSPPIYQEKMLEVFHALSKMLRPGGSLICVAGDVRRSSSPEGIYKTADELAASVIAHPELGLSVEWRDAHLVASHKRYLHAISSSTGQMKSALVERVFVATKT